MPIAALETVVDRNSLVLVRPVRWLYQRRAVRVMIDLWWTCDVPRMELGDPIRFQP